MRKNNRKHNEARNLSIVPNYQKNSIGSVLIKFEDTQVPERNQNPSMVVVLEKSDVQRTDTNPHPNSIDPFPQTKKQGLHDP